MLLNSKNKVGIDELTFLSTPRLLYVCEQDIVEFCLAHRVVHSHGFLEILYIYEGSGMVVINKKEYFVTQGDLIVYNAAVMHDEKTSKIGTLCMGVSNLCLAQLPPNCLLPRQASPVVHCDDRMASFVEGLFKELMALMEDSSREHQAICSYIMLLVLFIARHFGKSALMGKEPDSTRSSELCDRVKDYISQNYTEELSNEVVSHAVSVSPYHLSRVFKQETGCTPMQYVAQLRLGKAQTLLVHTDMPITEIAYNVGYNSSNSFNYAFLKLIGLTPGAYRKMYRL